MSIPLRRHLPENLIAKNVVGCISILYPNTLIQPSNAALRETQSRLRRNSPETHSLQKPKKWNYSGITFVANEDDLEFLLGQIAHKLYLKTGPLRYHL